MPNIDPRQLKRMMESMGMKNTPVEASQVIIKCDGKEIIIDNPEVTLVEVQGNKTFSVSGGSQREVSTAQIEVDKEDVQTVMEKTGASEEAARKALEEARGNMAEAILALTGE